MNKVYPDSTRHQAAFKKKTLGLRDTIDFANSSLAFQEAYNSYAKRYDMIIKEPHGFLFLTKPFLKVVGEKRKPTDVYIVKDSGNLTYDWKMHANISINEIPKALEEVMSNVFEQFVRLAKFKRVLNSASDSENTHVKLGSELLKNNQYVSIAKALLINPAHISAVNRMIEHRTKSISTEDFLLNVANIAIISASITSLVMTRKAPNKTHAAYFGATAGLAEALLAVKEFHLRKEAMRRYEASLFSGNLGFNYDEIYKVREEFRRDRIYAQINLFLSVLNIGDVLRLSNYLSKAGVTAKFLGRSDAAEALTNNLKNCTSPYCRKFVKANLFLEKVHGKEKFNDEFTKLVNNLTDAKSSREVDEIIRKAWFKNPSLAPLLEVDMMKKIFKNTFSPLSNTHDVNGRLTNLWLLGDEAYLTQLNPADRLDIMRSTLGFGRKEKKFSLFISKKHRIKYENLKKHMKKASRKFYNMNDRELFSFYEARGVIKTDRRGVSISTLFQNKNFKSFLRGELLATDIKLTKDRKLTQWRKILNDFDEDTIKQANAHVVENASDLEDIGNIKLVQASAYEDTKSFIDGMGTEQLKAVLSKIQGDFLDLGNLTPADYNYLSASARYMKNNLRKALGRYGKLEISDVSGKKIPQYKVKEEILDKVIDAEVPSLSADARKVLKDNLKHRLDNIVGNLENSYLQWMRDYNMFLNKTGFEIPAP